MIMKSLILLAFAMPFVANAKVTISKEYTFPVASVVSLETKVQKAFEREPELQEYPAFYEIDSANGIALWCPPHQPDKNGSGCSLSFQLKMPEGTTLSISKKLLLKVKAKVIQEKLAAVDPNNTQDHQHFGSFFEPQDTFGSHYYCEPDGTAGAKIWKCSLFVSESFN